MSNAREFQHCITARVKRDANNQDYLTFSTYLSFLKLTFRVYFPDLGKDRSRVFVSFDLSRREPTEGSDAPTG